MKKLLFICFLVTLCACNIGKSTEHAKQTKKPLEKNAILSQKVKDITEKLTSTSYPIKIDEIAQEYFKRDSLYYSDTTIYYFDELLDEKMVSAFASNTFEINNFSKLEEFPINSLYQNPLLKAPLLYASSDSSLVVLFLCVDENSEFKSPMIRAVYYDSDGNQIYFNENKQPYIECMSTVSIDATIISVKSTIVASSKILLENISISEDRKYEEIFGDEEIDLKTIPLMVIEQKNLEILIKNKDIVKKVINKDYKEIW